MAEALDVDGLSQATFKRSGESRDARSFRMAPESDPLTCAHLFLAPALFVRLDLLPVGGG